MIIMPAIFLTALTTTVNLGYAVYVALLGNNAMELFLFVFFTVFKMYMLLYIVGLITTITEWNQINCPGYKKILYTFTFPVFMFTYVPISVVALFKDVKWDHIEHVQSKSVHEIRNMN